MTGHDLARQLLALPDAEVLLDGYAVTYAEADSYEDDDGATVPCVSLGTDA